MNYDRLLTAVLDALCNPMIKLRNTFPITYSPETETRCKNFRWSTCVLVLLQLTPGSRDLSEAENRIIIM